MTEITINRGELLNFFDSDIKVRHHSSSIKAIIGEELMLALLVEYFRRNRETAKVVSRTCTTGNKKGHQLDAWLEVKHKSGPHDIVLYQVEVKSWSAHGVGGGSKYLRDGASEEELSRHMKLAWSHYWKDGDFLNPGLNKVLTPMMPPYAAKVLPLACLWAPLHPDGKLEPFFRPNEKCSNFPEVWVFSASSFLRSISLTDEPIKLKLPIYSERMRLLNNLFKPQEENII
jgi:hypothetical protein